MSAEHARAHFGIGEVLAQLRAEFPDVSVSKIRFLESEGLIQPARAPSGYRRFGPADVERLRYILRAQRDHYLPLRVIRDRLEAGDPAEDDQPRRGGRRPLSRRELLEAAGIDDAYLTELEDFGLVRPAGRQYGQDALEAARIIVDLGRYGVQARHLRAVRAAAENETSLIAQVVAPMLRQRSAGHRDRAGQAAREIAALSLQLHAALVGSALADAGLDDGGPLTAPAASPPAAAGPASHGGPGHGPVTAQPVTAGPAAARAAGYSQPRYARPGA